MAMFAVWHATASCGLHIHGMYVRVRLSTCLCAIPAHDLHIQMCILGYGCCCWSLPCLCCLSALCVIHRQKRKDALTAEAQEAIKRSWKANTRVYNNCRAVVGRRRKGCTPEAKQLKEESNTELYKKLKIAHPDIRVGQRMFEMLMPHNIRRMKERLRVTCSCQVHSDMQVQFRSILKYRQQLVGPPC